MAEDAMSGFEPPKLRFTSAVEPIGNDASGFSEPNFNAGTEPGNGNGDDGTDGFDPGRHVGRDKRNHDGSYTLKRGRKSGSGGNRSGSKTRLSTSIEGLTQALIVVHAGIASAVKTPELNLEQDEAKMLAQASTNVLDAYDIPVDPKTAAVVGLLFAVGSVYGPKVALVRMRIRAERLARTAEELPSEDVPAGFTPQVFSDPNRSFAAE